MGPGEGNDRRAAFIDLGTNSARVLVVSLRNDGVFQVLSDQKESVRLGEGEFKTNRLTSDAMDRAILVLSRFAQLARSLGVSDVMAVATSATRDAENSDVFINRVKKEADLGLKVISGLEEARLIHLGVARGYHLGNDEALFIDIGGGSTELILGGQNDFSFLDSLKAGTIRLYNDFFPSDYVGPVSRELYRDMKRYVRGRGVRSLKHIRSSQFKRVFASSGTARHLQEIAAGLFPDLIDVPVDGPVLSLDALRKVSRVLCPMSADEREKVKGVSSRRKDIIITGAAIMETVMEELSLDRVTVTDRSLRNGMLEDYLVKHGLIEGLSIREESVLRLGRSCGFDERHGRHIAKLALDLFDSSGKLGLHDLGAGARELLYYASLLHDIGMFLSFSDHHHHGAYIVRNAQLLGFTDMELQIMSSLVNYHRGKRPKIWDPMISCLDGWGIAVVRKCGVFLRMAESMDRSHRSIIEGARFESEGKRVRLSLSLREPEEWELERWAVERDMTDFKKIFGRTFSLLAV